MRSREVERVRRAVRSCAVRLPDVFARGARLVVGFSGGQDSTCLLHALANAHRDLDLLAVHVDHVLRPDSAAAAEQAEKSAGRLGVKCEIARVDVGVYRRTLKHASVEQAARAARYQVLMAAAEKHQAAAILVAHTADDQAETVLLNLLRGTALLGLAGMRLEEALDARRLGPALSGAQVPQKTARLVRPLLRVSRATTLAYCTQFGLVSILVEDASNQDRAYTRNRVRLELLPALEQFNPAIREVLARTADLAADDLRVLDDMAADVLAKLESNGEYDLRSFRDQPRALQRRMLRMALSTFDGHLVDVADSPIEDALDLLQTGQPNQTYHLPYGVEVCIKHQSFELQREGRALGRQARNTWESVGPRV
jgi:tRNA(Ile)-lysidine synthetase-like protein